MENSEAELAQTLINEKSVQVEAGKGEEKAAVLAAIKALDEAATKNTVLAGLTEDAVVIAGGTATVTLAEGVTATVTVTEATDPAIAQANEAITDALANVNDVVLDFGTTPSETEITAKLPVVSGIAYEAALKDGDTWTVTVKDTDGKGTPQTKDITVTVASE